MNNAQEIIAIASEKYEQLVEGSADYELIFDKYLWEFVDRRQAITNFRLFKINHVGKDYNFHESSPRRIWFDDPPPQTQVIAFHGPSFQEDQCSFDFETNMCTGHSDKIMVFTDNPLYNYCNQGGRTRDTSVGYLILCKLIISRKVKSNPESTQSLADYFDEGYDTILDYGNRKWIKKMSDEILPLCLIEYKRKYNSRLDNPLNQIFEAEIIQPSPEVTFKTIDHNSDEFTQLQLELPAKINILSIRKIINPFLEQKYLEFRANYSSNAREITVFHGTTFECADLIAKFNLDWRKCTYGKYGWGVHFAEHPNYASYFPLNNCRKEHFNGSKKCMVMFTIIFDPTKLYNVEQEQVNGMKLPPEGYDTVHITFGRYVKFNDNEFLPKYIIVYNN